MKIVLLGSIPKGDDIRKGWVDWKPAFIKAIIKHVPQATFLDGDEISDDVGAELVVGHDLAMIKNADCVVVDATKKIGAGTAQEMVMAKYFKKPVISVVPNNSHYHKDELIFRGKKVKNWIHPFIDVSSDYVAHSLNETGLWIKQLLDDENNSNTKDISVFTRCIAEFEEFL